VRIAIDILGSDNHPSIIVRGAIEGYLLLGKNIELHLVGDKDIIYSVLEKYGVADDENIVVHHTTEYISMDDEVPKVIKRKRKASMIMAMELVRDGVVDAIFSPGNTGAFMSSALLYLGRLRGIKRPAIAIPIPRYEGPPLVLIDAGANAEVKSEYLVQFAYMGDAFYKEVFSPSSSPRIGLLSNGEEDVKGNSITKKAYHKLLKTELNFVGYVEGRDLFGLGKGVDVVVTDGFTGNIVLKTAEGASKFIFKAIKDVMMSNLITKIGALLLKKALLSLRERFDHESYGGAPLLGVKGICIIGHGSSSNKAVRNAIRVAKELYDKKINEDILKHL
jgi:glycerol-3-phosphate acyltransferase PlsX